MADRCCAIPVRRKRPRTLSLLLLSQQIRVHSPTDIYFPEEQRDLKGLSWKNSSLAADANEEERGTSPATNQTVGNAHLAKG